MANAVLLCFILLMPSVGLAQNGVCEKNLEDGWCWGVRMTEAKAYYKTLDSLAQQKNYEEALPYLEWLLNNTPNLHKVLYIHGEKIYRHLADEKGGFFAHKVLGLIDQRIAIFGDLEYQLLQRQGRLAYRYLYPLRKVNQSYNDTLYAIYANIFKVVGDEIQRSNLTFYALTANIQHRRDKISTDSLFYVKRKTAKLIDKKLNEFEADSLEQQYWQKAEDIFNTIFESPIEDPIDYSFIKEKWGERILVQKDTILAKKALKFLIADKQSDSLLFMQSVQVLHEARPRFGTALLLYRWHIKALSPPNKVEKYRNECRELSQSRLDTAKFYEMMGDEARMANDYQLARIHYLNAIFLMGQDGEKIYSKVADLYIASIHRCVEDPNAVNNPDSWAIYLAAYDMYAKAKDKEGMESARRHFPTKADIFINFHPHSDMKLKVPCWIGGEVSIKSR